VIDMVRSALEHAGEHDHAPEESTLDEEP